MTGCPLKAHLYKKIEKQKPRKTPRLLALLWQGRQESNPQPSVLETDALPIELLPCALRTDIILTYYYKLFNRFCGG
jgi:hypothetical protein